MIVLHCAPVFWGRPNGVTACVPRLIAAQADQGTAVALGMTLADQGGRPEFSFPVFPRDILLRGRRGLDLPAPFDRPDVVVFHSTYIPAHAAIARKLRRSGVPYLICAHGGLTRFAGRQKWFKKGLGDLLFFNRVIRHARAVQCLTQGEAAVSGHWGRPMFVVGNGIDLPPSESLASPGQTAQRRLAFIGRLAIEHKGLDLLLEACALIRRELQGHHARVELYGPDQAGSAKWLADRIRSMGLSEVVSLGGPVYGAEKSRLLQQTDVFVHASRWEGHPMSVLEALSYGVPCLLTPGSNMADEVARCGAGWPVESSPSAIAAGIVKILASDRQTLQQAGENARRLVAREYTWDQIAQRSVEAYSRYAG
jgi:glycosyltransferase involved in cell wall biosynthesis